MRFLFLVFFLLQAQAWGAGKVAPAKKVAAAKSPVMRRAPASDPNMPIEVRGQSRNLNMMLILQNENELIDFIKLRKEYQVETKRMNY